MDMEKDTDKNATLPGLPSRAITTLTTSILLAMSSPRAPHHHEHSTGQTVPRKCGGPCRSPAAGKNHCNRGRQNPNACFEPDDPEFDPSGVRLAFTTGPYWLPSTLGQRPDDLIINPLTLDHLSLNMPSTDLLMSYQKEDWVYSNPWMIPWLSWHSAPVYSMLHNFSVIGAPNIDGYKRQEFSWMDWLSVVFCGLLQGLVADIAPHTVHSVTLPPPTMFGQPILARSGPEPVPWVF